MTAALASLLLGLTIGYLGQRSRLCFVAGFRNVVLTGQWDALKGPIGTLVGALVGYLVCGALGGAVPDFPLAASDEVSWAARDMLLTLGAAVGLGWMSAEMGGCPYRMHVLAAEGKRSVWYYLLGFYAGIPFYNEVTGPLLRSFKS
jgi:hypothetical protein